MVSSKRTEEMTEQELKQAYEIGKKWVSDRVQIVGTDKNALGEAYDNDGFLRGLERLEEIEDEFRKRGTIL